MTADHPTPAEHDAPDEWRITEYHGQTYIWTLRSSLGEPDSWSCGGARYPDLTYAEQTDGPLRPTAFRGSTPALLAELARRDAALADLTRQRDRLLLQAGTGEVEIEQLRADVEHLRAQLRVADDTNRMLAELANEQTRDLTRQRDGARFERDSWQASYFAVRDRIAVLAAAITATPGEPSVEGDEVDNALHLLAQLERQAPVIEAAPLLWALYEAWGQSASVEPTSEQQAAGYCELLSLEDSKRLDLAFSAIDDRAAEIHAALSALGPVDPEATDG